MSFDLIVRGAQVRNVPHLQDIAVKDGVIAAIDREIPAQATEVIEAGGRLVTPGFVDTQFHVGKSFYGRETNRYNYQVEEWNPPGLEERFAGRFHSSLADYDVRNDHIIPILKQWAFKEENTLEVVTERIVEALLMGLKNGVTAYRLFMDVDTFGGLQEIQAAVEARRRLAGLMQIQICAFPQEGLETNPGTRDLMKQAMDAGADVVGGHPWVEWTDELCNQHTDFCFELAQQHGTMVHFLTDDVSSPMSRTLEYVAARTLQLGYVGNVATSHNGALASYPEAHAQYVMNLVRNADIDMVCNSHVNLLGGLTRVHDLADLGVNIALGQDDIDNFYYPFGRVDPLEWAWSLAHQGKFSYPKGIEQVFDMITVNGARTLNLENYGLQVGARADLVVLDCTHAREAIQFQSDRLHVISAGKRVAGTTRESWVAAAGA